MPTFQVTGPDGKKYRVSGDSPAGAMQALRKMVEGEASPSHHREFEGEGLPGFDPETGMVKQSDRGAAIRQGFADTASLGFGDELASGVVTGIEKLRGNEAEYDDVLADMRRSQTSAQEEHPADYLVGQGIGGLAQAAAAGPLTASARFAGSTMFPRIAAGSADGLVAGGLYGAGSGEDAKSRIAEALIGGGIGGTAGAAFPLVSAGLGKGYQVARDALKATPIARQAGASPESLRMLGNVMEADASLGPQGRANMTAAGPEAMLADAGPNARAVLDTSIQRGGPGALVARDRISERVGRGAQDLTEALDQNLGQPQGATAVRTAIRQGSAGARSGAYDEAYNAPIDYADPRGMEIENLVKSRVPGSAIQRANQLMRAEGHQSRQILAKIADDGTVTYERLPDVRQLDYITRALNDLAEAGEGAGALGGQTALGRAYQGLSREIRDNLRDLVPEYGVALQTAADPIRRSKAVELGYSLMSPSVSRDAASEAIQGMTGAERQALAQGLRSRVDDTMAQVSRTLQDGDMPARESIKALRDLSSRANREKLEMVLGPEQARSLFDEIDRITASFDLRASVAENSKTYARQATDRRVQEVTKPGTIGTLAEGKPVNAAQRVIQAMTGRTPERLSQKQDEVYSELSELLTRQGGAGQRVYDAISEIGTTDAATKANADRIARALLGLRTSYPATTLTQDRLLSQ